jgi:hypothetical protein
MTEKYAMLARPAELVIQTQPERVFVSDAVHQATGVPVPA